ncbi:MAG TPA: hypothetical protein EYP85_12415 [Armatimonadetes bacterium]|nr:hypothetical protein [Armatimonadota bacterium]
MSSWICLFPLLTALSAAPLETLISWDFRQGLQGWRPNGHLADVRLTEEGVQVRVVNRDPFLSSPLFEIPANPWQWIEVRLKASVDGSAEFFWTNTTETQYAGFSPGKETPFAVVGDGEWHTYRIYPYWHAEKKIIKLRFDLPGGQGGTTRPPGEYTIAEVKIVDPHLSAEPVQPPFTFDQGLQGWQVRQGLTGLRAEKGVLRATVTRAKAMLVSPRLAVPAEDYSFLTLRLRADRGSGGAVAFVSDAANGLHWRGFILRSDGQWHTYNLDVGADSHWRGNIIALALKPSDQEGARIELDTLFFSPEAAGPPDLEVRYLGFDQPLARAGKPAEVIALVRNHGGEPAEDVRGELRVGKGVQVEAVSPGGKVEFGIDETLRWRVRATRPLTTEATLVLRGSELAQPLCYTTVLTFTAPPAVPQTDYVPEPQPVQDDYLVGVYYFPGWRDAGRWQPILSFRERQPLLGWYREGDPEVADWHIKWALEHGIDFFIYDWYWVQGARNLEHALHEGFFRAKYQHLLKFCLLWANHNPPHTTTVEDLENVTRFWVNNYFWRDNYLKIEGQPVVVIFSPGRISNDLGSEKVRSAFARMRQICRENGLPGLYLVDCGNDSEAYLRRLAAEGYDAVSGYNWPRAGMRPGEGQHSPFDALIVGYRQMWESILRVGVIPLIPPVSGGWDSRPWHGDRALVRYGRTPEKFAVHLREVKALLDAGHPGVPVKMCFIEAWNEWGEGSYIEPQREFGFGYLDAIREVFAPHAGPHTDLVPADVGLGPYDVPALEYKTAWEFDREGDFEGWGSGMGLGDKQVAGGALQAVTTTHDPAFFGPPMRARAEEYPVVALRIKASADFEGQLFWATNTSPISEGNSLRFPVKGDGQWQEILLPVGRSRRWRGIITQLRLDVGSQRGVQVAVDYLRLLAQEAEDGQ